MSGNDAQEQIPASAGGGNVDIYREGNGGGVGIVSDNHVTLDNSADIVLLEAIPGPR